jgi:TPR repeat protein
MSHASSAARATLLLAVLTACVSAPPGSTVQAADELGPWRARAKYAVELPGARPAPHWITRARQPGSGTDEQSLVGACERAHGSACFLLAGRLLTNAASAHAALDAEVRTRIIELRTRSCDLGEALGCNAAGDSFDGTWGFELNAERSRELWAGACELGVPTACTSLGLLHANGDFGEPIAGMVEQLFEHGCSQGDASSCHHLALRRDAAGDLPLVLDLHAFACRAGQYRSCDALYRWAQIGCSPAATRPEDGCTAAGGDAPEVSITALESSCRKGDARACTALGQSMLTEDQQPAPPRAVRLFSTACEQDDPWACWMLLLELEFVQGPDLSSLPAEFVQRLQRHCEEGFVASCMEHARTAAVAGELERARELFTRGCVGGDQPACIGLFSLCVGGHGPSCASLQPTPLAR